MNTKFNTFSKSKACNVYTATENQVRNAGNVKLNIKLPENASNNTTRYDVNAGV